MTSAHNGEDVPTTGEAPETAAAQSEQVERDLDELTQARQERDEYLELAKRAQADFENYRKRVARDAAEAERRGLAKLAGELLPVVDNLERALRAAGIELESAESNGDADALAHGVLLVYRDLRGILQRAGVEALDPAGERFDPQWHEAVSTHAAPGVEAGQVVDVVDKGYRLDGTLLRPARVVVSE
jgi:molecular chaperone GrpE